MSAQLLSRWLRRIALSATFIATSRCGADRGPLPGAGWLPHQRDLQIVARTFPAPWAKGARWTIEYEFDSRTLGDHVPLHKRGEYSVRDVADGRALIETLGISGGSEETRFIWDTRRFRLESLPENEYMPPPAFEPSGYGWKPLDEDTPPVCFSRILPWQAPIIHRLASAVDVRDVLGERSFGDVHQRAWIEDGMVHFEVASEDPSREILSVVWRPGDPWWAKFECFLPGRTTSPPTPTRKQWPGPAWPGPTATRDARARLVAIDGVPIEPLPWEHPPADWMDPTGR